ncbi:Serpentine receptor class X 45, partial [Toxocara canis]
MFGLVAASLLTVVSICGLLLNALIVYLVYKKSSLHGPYGMLCVSMAITNSASEILFATYCSTRTLFDRSSLDLQNAFIGHLINACYYSGILIHLLIAVNRYTAIMHPAKYTSIFTQYKTIAAIVFLNGVSFTSLLLFFIDGCHMMYHARTALWIHKKNKCAQYSAYFIDVGATVVAILTACLLDYISLYKMRKMNQVAKLSSSYMQSQAAKRKAKE